MSMSSRFSRDSKQAIDLKSEADKLQKLIDNADKENV